MAIAYQFGEMEAWSEFFKDGAYPMFSLKCKRGHMVDSPVPLEQSEVDNRCLKCSERQY